MKLETGNKSTGGRIVLIGPLPPLIGGDTVSTLNLLESRYWQKAGYTLASVNVAATDRIRLNDERLALPQFARFIKILFRSAVSVPSCDIVLLWSNSRFIYTAGPFLIFLARIMRRPVIVKLFGVFLGERVLLMRRPVKAILRTVLKMCRQVLPQTPELRDLLIGEMGLSPESVTCFPNFIPDSSFGPLGKDRGFRGRCIFAGQIKREKGVFDIVEAVGGRKGFSCDFFGPIASRDEEAFLEALSRHDNLSFRGIADPKEMSGIISGYDLLLFPSYHPGEGYPAVVLQAFAAGVAVIAGDWQSVPELVEDGVRGLLVPVRDPEAIYSAARRLEEDKGLYADVTANAYQYALGFSEKRIVEDLLIGRILRGM